MDILAGVRVLDFTAHVAGPQATILLAYMGAEVIKVEGRAYSDVLRTTAGIAGIGTEKTAAGMFNSMNAGKLGITLNLTHPKGAELAKRLVKISDVVVDNFRAGVMDKLGLGYPALKEVKPDIIMLSASSHGATGPESRYSGFAVTMGPLSGLSHVTGYPGGPPTILRNSVDSRIGNAAAFAILVAINYRQETGKGQFIDLSGREALSCSMGEVIMDYAMNGRVQSRNGNRDDIMAPHDCYRCKGEDKWVSIAVSNDEDWEALCQTVGNPKWTKEERFSAQFSRWQNQDELDRLIEEWTINYTHYEVMEILQRAGVAAVSSFSNEDLFNDPHCREREYLVTVQHTEVGQLYALAPPWKLSVTPGRVTGPSPVLGEHNEHVFGELLGMSQDEIARLEDEGVFE
jgi:benzylsuccinate CoA-transferase BbsF subunit